MPCKSLESKSVANVRIALDRCVTRVEQYLQRIKDLDPSPAEFKDSGLRLSFERLFTRDIFLKAEEIYTRIESKSEDGLFDSLHELAAHSVEKIKFASFAQELDVLEWNVRRSREEQICANRTASIKHVGTKDEHFLRSLAGIWAGTKLCNGNLKREEDTKRRFDLKTLSEQMPFQASKQRWASKGFFASPRTRPDFIREILKQYGSINVGKLHGTFVPNHNGVPLFDLLGGVSVPYLLKNDLWIDQHAPLDLTSDGPVEQGPEKRDKSAHEEGNNRSEQKQADNRSFSPPSEAESEESADNSEDDSTTIGSRRDESITSTTDAEVYLKRTSLVERNSSSATDSHQRKPGKRKSDVILDSSKDEEANKKRADVSGRVRDCSSTDGSALHDDGVAGSPVDEHSGRKKKQGEQPSPQLKTISRAERWARRAVLDEEDMDDENNAISEVQR